MEPVKWDNPAYFEDVSDSEESSSIELPNVADNEEFYSAEEYESDDSYNLFEDC